MGERDGIRVRGRKRKKERERRGQVHSLIYGGTLVVLGIITGLSCLLGGDLLQQ